MLIVIIFASGCGTARDEAVPADAMPADTARTAIAPPAAGASVQGSSGQRDTNMAPVPTVRAAALAKPPRDRDQAFLRAMLDHHEAALALAHDQMMAPAGHAEHGAAADPGDVDAVLDIEKRRMLALLDSLYGEAYSPRAAPPPAATGSSPSPATPAAAGGADHDVYRTRLSAQLRAGVTLVDRYRHELRRPPVRALADSLRETQLAQLRLLGPTPRSH